MKKEIETDVSIAQLPVTLTLDAADGSITDAAAGRLFTTEVPAAFAPTAWPVALAMPVTEAEAGAAAGAGPGGGGTTEAAASPAVAPLVTWESSGKV